MPTKVSSIAKYFEKKKDTWVFNSKKLQILVPAIYEERGLLSLGTTVTSLGIFKIIINDTVTTNMLLLAKIGMNPSLTEKVTEDDYDYISLTFNKGDVFINNTNIVKDGNLTYDVFMTFLALGKIPPFIDYSSIQSLYNNDLRCCGISLGINHSIYEMIFAHMYRDKKDPYKFYRYTTMKSKPTIVPIHQISHGPKSNSAKIIGSYMNEGVVSALVTEPDDDPSTIENMMRA